MYRVPFCHSLFAVAVVQLLGLGAELVFVLFQNRPYRLFQETAALPLGKATPDRKGITAKADVNWADKVIFNARVNMVTQSNLIGYDPVTFAPISTENKFTEFAAGLGVDAGALAGLDRQILLQGSYSHGEEDSYLKRKADRIVAGFTADVWGPIALLGGIQMYTKEFGNGYAVAAAAVTKATEMLALGGARVKLAPLSYVSLQGGLLKNELEYSVIGVPAVNKISISKLVLLADVTVNF